MLGKHVTKEGRELETQVLGILEVRESSETAPGYLCPFVGQPVARMDGNGGPSHGDKLFMYTPSPCRRSRCCCSYSWCLP